MRGIVNIRSYKGSVYVYVESNEMECLSKDKKASGLV